MRESQRDEIADIYDVAAWGAGYFEISPRGRLLIRAARGDPRYADLYEIVEGLLAKRKLSLPVLLRFPQLLENQLKKLHGAYGEAAREFGFSGRHFPVFPM